MKKVRNLRGKFWYRRLRGLLDEQFGAVGAMAAIGILICLGFGGLALDIGHLVSVKNELQKAADAGALAGARALNMGTPIPNWTSGQTVASQTTQKNKADGTLISNSGCQVQAGYWDLSWNASTAPANLKSQSITPSNLDVPAVKVTINIGSGPGSAPVSILFSPILGKSTMTVSASSVGALVKQSPVNNIPPGDAFPLATPQTWAQQHCNADPPVSFRIGDSQGAGDWTSFLIDANDVPTVRQLIDTGNPTPLKVGDQIWIEPGTKTTLYDEAANRIGQTVLLAVVPDNFDTHAYTTILAFVPFYIENAVGGSGKYIQGHFVKDYVAPGAGGSPVTPNYGAYAYSCKLVN